MCQTAQHRLPCNVTVLRYLHPSSISKYFGIPYWEIFRGSIVHPLLLSLYFNAGKLKVRSCLGKQSKWNQFVEERVFSFTDQKVKLASTKLISWSFIPRTHFPMHGILACSCKQIPFIKCEPTDQLVLHHKLKIYTSPMIFFKVVPNALTVQKRN